MHFISFIGFGNMAQAIAEGLIKSEKLSYKQISASARSFEKLENNCKKLGGIKAFKTNVEAVKFADIVILAVKPKQLEKVIDEIRFELKGKTVISIVVGQTFTKLQKLIDLGDETQILITLPNTPMKASEGVLIVDKKHNLDENTLSYIINLFESIALIEWVDSNYFSIAGTLSGCTPAFFSMVIEALADAGVKYGLDRAQSYRIVAKALEGTGALQLKTKKHPAILKDEVTSPGGTTIKGVTCLEMYGVRNAFIKAIDEIEES